MCLLPTVPETGQLAPTLLPADARGVSELAEAFFAQAELEIVPYVAGPAQQDGLPFREGFRWCFIANSVASLGGIFTTRYIRQKTF